MILTLFANRLADGINKATALGCGRFLSARWEKGFFNVKCIYGQCSRRLWFGGELGPAEAEQGLGVGKLITQG